MLNHYFIKKTVIKKYQNQFRSFFKNHFITFIISVSKTPLSTFITIVFYQTFNFLSKPYRLSILHQLCPPLCFTHMRSCLKMQTNFDENMLPTRHHGTREATPKSSLEVNFQFAKRKLLSPSMGICIALNFKANTSFFKAANFFKFA